MVIGAYRLHANNPLKPMSLTFSFITQIMSSWIIGCQGHRRHLEDILPIKRTPNIQYSPGGATHSLGVCTNCETTAPSFWQWTGPGFSLSKFTAPSFQRNPRKPLSNQHLLNNFFVSLHLILLICTIKRH